MECYFKLKGNEPLVKMRLSIKIKITILSKIYRVLSHLGKAQETIKPNYNDGKYINENQKDRVQEGKRKKLETDTKNHSGLVDVLEVHTML